MKLLVYQDTNDQLSIRNDYIVDSDWILSNNNEFKNILAITAFTGINFDLLGLRNRVIRLETAN